MTVRFYFWRRHGRLARTFNNPGGSMDTFQTLKRPWWMLAGLSIRRRRGFGVTLALIILVQVFMAMWNPAHAGTDVWDAGAANCPNGGPTGTVISATTPGAQRSAWLADYNSRCAGYACFSYANPPSPTWTGQGTASGSSVSGFIGTYTPNTYCTATVPYPTSTTGGSLVVSCSAGKVLNASGTCVTAPASCPAAGTVYTSGYYDMGTSPTGSFPSYSVAPNVCGVTFSGSCPDGSGMVGGVKHYYCKGSYNYVGGSPDTTSTLAPVAATGTLPASTCAAGQQGGYVNGSWVCLTVAGTGGNTTAATSGGQQTTTTTVTNGDGSKTTTNVTSNPGGSSTVTTSTVNASGVPIGSTSNDPLAGKDDVTKFCTLKPNSPICKDQVDSAFSGACGGFTYTGDAIQGAIAKELYQRNCQLYESNAASVTGQSVVDGTDGKLATATAKTTVSMSGAITQTTFLTPGTLADQSLTVQGQAIVIPWSNLNSYIGMLGMMLVAVSLIVAARIATGG